MTISNNTNWRNYKLNCNNGFITICEITPNNSASIDDYKSMMAQIKESITHSINEDGMEANLYFAIDYTSLYSATKADKPICHIIAFTPERNVLHHIAGYANTICSDYDWNRELYTMEGFNDEFYFHTVEKYLKTSLGCAEYQAIRHIWNGLFFEENGEICFSEEETDTFNSSESTIDIKSVLIKGKMVG
jgi:hypothetical protein